MILLIIVKNVLMNHKDAVVVSAIFYLDQINIQQHIHGIAIIKSGFK
jgi:hypothetical protein